MFCIEVMKNKYLIWVFLCHLTKADLITFNYTLDKDNLAWNTHHLYPVLDGSSKVMQNRSFSLAFYPSRNAFGVFARTADPEPVMLWDSGATVSWGSTFVLDSTGSLMLRDGSDSHKKFWSKPGIERLEMERNGNLVLYDGNETAVWQSIDHSSDVVVLGQNFTKLSKGKSRVVMENGNFRVKQGNNKTMCKIYTGGLTAGLRLYHVTGGGGYSLVFTSFNSSGMQTCINITIKHYHEINIHNDFMFLSLQEDGSFNLYSLLNGKWTTESLCCSSDRASFQQTCQSPVISYICILIASLVIMIYSEVRSLFSANSSHHILPHILLLASLAAILFSSLLALIRLFPQKPPARRFAIISVDMIVLQVSVRGILQFLARNSSPRRRWLIALICLHFLMMQKSVHVWLLSRLLGKPDPGEDDITISLSSYSYPEMEVVTDHFGKQIGRGGFGGVYEGVLLDGRKVAVKKLESSSQGRQEFKSEIEILGKLHHVNLVQLLGFCAEGAYKLLIYEFMPNGSLDKWIFNVDYLLDWPQRMKIIMGTAQGLAYLHQECNPRILHLDVKPQNILLDELFTAKLADFGLCKLMPADETSLMLTKMMGTFGYLAPEWLKGSVSEKSDVYSFGIVVLEVVSGRRSYSSMAMSEELSFVNWASQRCDDGTLLDSRLAKEDCDAMQLKRVIDVAFWCACQDANLRPSMSMVVKMLEGNNDYTLPLEPGCIP